MRGEALRELETWFVRERRGSWTPTYFGLTTAGTTTYTMQEGRYAVHGSVVELWGRVTWTAATGTGQAVIGGLPFAVPSIGNLFYPAALWVSDVTFGGSGVQLLGWPGQPQLRLYTLSSNATSTAINIEAAGDIIFNVRYLMG